MYREYVDHQSGEAALSVSCCVKSQSPSRASLEASDSAKPRERSDNGNPVMGLDYMLLLSLKRNFLRMQYI